MTSAKVRPLRTPERAIGSERKRSMMPFVMSSANAIAVVIDANVSVWM